MVKKNVFVRILTALVASKFEPIEFVLAFSAAAHGLWLILAGMHFDTTFQTITGSTRTIEILFSIYMILSGLFVLVSARLEHGAARSAADLGLFIGWSFACVLALVAAGFSGVLWMGYLTISLISALVYLNIRVGAWYGTD